MHSVMADENKHILNEAFQDSVKPSLVNMLKNTLADKDFLFIGDYHGNDEDGFANAKAYEFIARPDVMELFADAGVTVIDLEFASQSLAHVSNLYAAGDISHETMDYVVTHLFDNTDAADNDRLKAISEIITQAKTLGIEIRSSDHDEPDYTEEEFNLITNGNIALIDYHTRLIEKTPNFHSMSDNEKIDLVNKAVVDFEKENPEILADYNKGMGMRDVREAVDIAFDKADFEEKYADISPEVAAEVNDVLADINDYNIFNPDRFDSLSPVAQEAIQDYFGGDMMKRRFDADPVVANRMDEARGEGKLVSIYGMGHFNRAEGDIDAALGEDRTAVINLKYDENLEAHIGVSGEKISRVFNYSVNDKADIKIDLEKGTWVDDKGKLELNMDDSNTALHDDAELLNCGVSASNPCL